MEVLAWGRYERGGRARVAMGVDAIDGKSVVYTSFAQPALLYLVMMLS